MLAHPKEQSLMCVQGFHSKLRMGWTWSLACFTTVYRYCSIPQDLAGRCLFVFERAEGVNNVWDKLSAASKV